MYRKICNHPGCTKYAAEGQRFCEKHLEEHRKPFTGGWLSDYAKAFYHSGRWRKEKAEFLKENPYCALCGKEATDVHHQFDDFYDYHNPNDFFDQNHWVSLCDECHQQITREAMKRRRRKKYVSH